MPSDEEAADRPLTLTERARRAQLIGVTIDLVARHGYAGTSLARIAEAAGISKAAVLYHFPSKEAVVQAAYAEVIGSLTGYVGQAVDAASGAAAVEAYIRSLIAYMRDHPGHTRMIVEAVVRDTGISDRPNDPSRRQAVARLVEAATAARDYRADTDPHVTAVIVNGAIDAIVAEWLANSDFDTARATDQLIALLTRALSPQGQAATA